MALWPFRRKASQRRSSTGRGRLAGDHAAPPPRSMTEPPMATTDTPGGTAGSSPGPDRTKSKRQRNSPGNKKIQRRNRTYSFSPGRRDSIRVARAREESVPPLPAGPIPVAAMYDSDYGGKGPSGVTHEADLRNRVPTLHHSTSQNKRRAQPLPRKKSSKRRKEDHDREAEIKAMSHSHPVPTRPATETWIAGRPLKRESKRTAGGHTKDWHRPDSDISLPESIHSSMSSDSEHVSFRVSALDVLAPRPTIRYASSPVYGVSNNSEPVRTLSQKRKLSERGPIPEATLKAHKRVDDLADDLDASDLRELMERDKRRRERKREKEQQRVERRLARRAERQRVEEAEAKRNGTPPPQNLERGVLGRESPPAGQDTTSAVVTSSRRRQSAESLSKQTEPAAAASEAKRAPSPLDQFHRVDSITQTPTEFIEAAQPEQPPRPEELEPRTSRSPSPRLINLIRSKKRRSKSPPQTDLEKTDDKPSAPASTRVVSKSESESAGRPSDSSSSGKAWMSIFKWARTGKNRRSSGPSSFSNTSRDSMLASQPPNQTPNYLPIQRSNSKVPKRTMSRFREDLPELPLSPPDSRVASPEADFRPAEPLPVIADDVVMRYDTPTSGHRATPSSMHRDEMQTSPAPQSMSLASIDSEGSWLSGRAAGKRASSGMRGSLTNYPLRSVSGDSEDHDDDAVQDDDFLNIVDDKKLHRKSTGEARPSSDEEEQEDEQSPKWGNLTRTPTFTHRRETMRSREGLLLQTYDDDDKEIGIDKDSEDGTSFGGESPTVPQRATSVNFGKGHIRNFSAGSAKLLELSPRASTDKRRSVHEPVTQ
ncbi:hypothetical protein JX265_003600 [Neoarthrinium moseri]|uniref:Uncharacterized protein n=1 Tax=Neoarthrinium moseri TaxID=1658444 RepID=A0A9Q0APE6_9PEZI|nr:hypothetical protein JX266_001218 [Neoarthrinium moseri]KAI1877592.1 hypothetical protein JX265_003600 [Neoarthrinium moseri]